MPELSHRAAVLQESAIRKLDLTVMQQRDVRFHRLNIGQPDVPTPAPLLDAIHQWRPEVIAYGPASGLPALREAAAGYHSRWSPGLGWKDVAVTTGGSEALLFAFTAVCDPGDEILVPSPTTPTTTASPGWTVTEKSMTAGISRSRVKKEIDRFSISRIGPSCSHFAINFSSQSGFRDARLRLAYVWQAS